MEKDEWDEVDNEYEERYEQSEEFSDWQDYLSMHCWGENMKALEFVEKFDEVLKENGIVYIDFKDGFFVADKYSFDFFGETIVYLSLGDTLIGRISLSKVGDLNWWNVNVVVNIVKNKK